MEAPKVDSVQRSSYGPKPSTACALAQRHQHDWEPLREQAEEAKLPHKQEIEEHNAIKVPNPREQAVNGAKCRHKRRSTVLLPQSTALAHAGVLRTDDGSGQLRYQRRDDVALHGANIHQRAADALCDDPAHGPHSWGTRFPENMSHYHICQIVPLATHL